MRPRLSRGRLSIFKKWIMNALPGPSYFVFTAYMCSVRRFFFTIHCTSGCCHRCRLSSANARRETTLGEETGVLLLGVVEQMKMGESEGPVMIMML